MWSVLFFLFLSSDAERMQPKVYSSKCIRISNACPNKYITFWLYTRATKDNPYQLDLQKMENILEAPFINNRPFKILIHGLTGNRNASPNAEIRPALFENADYNVISVDYGPIAQLPCYETTVINVKAVAHCTAQLIDYLVWKLDVSLDEFHVIGHSIGAHVSGQISSFLARGNLKWITGLDPAYPLFDITNKQAVLDYSDADFVEVIHTDGDDKGMFDPSGHVDFYVNGGMEQPGCAKIPGCNHKRSCEYYAESINTEIGFWARQCTFTSYSHGLCGCIYHDEILMGEYVPHRARGLYFLRTRASPPFAVGHC